MEKWAMTLYSANNILILDVYQRRYPKTNGAVHKTPTDTDMIK